MSRKWPSWPSLLPLFAAIGLCTGSFRFHGPADRRQRALEATDLPCGSNVMVKEDEIYMFDSRSAVIYESSLYAAQAVENGYYYESERRKRAGQPPMMALKLQNPQQVHVRGSTPLRPLKQKESRNSQQNGFQSGSVVSATGSNGPVKQVNSSQQSVSFNQKPASKLTQAVVSSKMEGQSSVKSDNPQQHSSQASLRLPQQNVKLKPSKTQQSGVQVKPATIQQSEVKGNSVNSPQGTQTKTVNVQQGAVQSSRLQGRSHEDQNDAAAGGYHGGQYGGVANYAHNYGGNGGSGGSFGLSYYHGGGGGANGGHANNQQGYIQPMQCEWTYFAAGNCSLESHIIYFKPGDLDCYKQQFIVSDNYTDFRMCGHQELYPGFRAETPSLVIKYWRHQYAYRHIFKGYVTCTGRAQRPIHSDGFEYQHSDDPVPDMTPQVDYTSINGSLYDTSNSNYNDGSSSNSYMGSSDYSNSSTYGNGNNDNSSNSSYEPSSTSGNSTSEYGYASNTSSTATYSNSSYFTNDQSYSSDKNSTYQNAEDTKSSSSQGYFYQQITNTSSSQDSMNTGNGYSNQGYSSNAGMGDQTYSKGQGSYNTANNGNYYSSNKTMNKENQDYSNGTIGQGYRENLGNPTYQTNNQSYSSAKSENYSMPQEYSNIYASSGSDTANYGYYNSNNSTNYMESPTNGGEGYANNANGVKYANSSNNGGYYNSGNNGGYSENNKNSGYSVNNNGGYSENNNGGYSENNNSGYSENNNGGYSENNDGGYSENNNGGYSENNNGGYSENNNGGYSENNNGGYSENNNKGGYSNSGNEGYSNTNGDGSTGEGYYTANSGSQAYTDENSSNYKVNYSANSETSYGETQNPTYSSDQSGNSPMTAYENQYDSGKDSSSSSDTPTDQSSYYSGSNSYNGSANYTSMPYGSPLPMNPYAANMYPGSPYGINPYGNMPMPYFGGNYPIPPQYGGYPQMPYMNPYTPSGYSTGFNSTGTYGSVPASEGYQPRAILETSGRSREEQAASKPVVGPYGSNPYLRPVQLPALPPSPPMYSQPNYLDYQVSLPEYNPYSPGMLMVPPLDYSPRSYEPYLPPMETAPDAPIVIPYPYNPPGPTLIRTGESGTPAATTSGNYQYLMPSPTNPAMKVLVTCQQPYPYPCIPPSSSAPLVSRSSIATMSALYGR